MSRILTVLFALASAVMLSTPMQAASGGPSSDALGMPGALGTFEFMPPDWMSATLTHSTATPGAPAGVLPKAIVSQPLRRLVSNLRCAFVSDA